MKKTRIGSFCSIVALLAAPFSAAAQSGTNSPYSQYGLGILSDQSQSQSRGMGGVGIGMRSGKFVNTLNPASYSSVDSLTMIIDAGVSGQITNFKEGGKKVNANNANFEFVSASFRILPKVGLSVGVLPFTNIGYNYTSSTPSDNDPNVTANTTNSGSGGIHQAYLGFGYNIFKGLSVGANVAYLWGTYTRSISTTLSETTASAMARSYTGNVMNYKVDFGLQWEQQLNKADILTVGLTYGLGHNIGGKPQVTTTSTWTGGYDTKTLEATDGLSIPHTAGFGLSLNHANKWLVAADYTFQKWGVIDYPMLNNTTGEYISTSDLLKDRHKVAVGAEWTPDYMSRSLLKRINYRIGASFNTPYIKVNGQDGPKEYSVSAGFGIPITNTWNNRSMLSISGQWCHAAANDLITENTFRINIGLTFNERWFMKWKVE